MLNYYLLMIGPFKITLDPLVIQMNEKLIIKIYSCRISKTEIIWPPPRTLQEKILDLNDPGKGDGKLDPKSYLKLLKNIISDIDLFTVLKCAGGWKFFKGILFKPEDTNLHEGFPLGSL